MFSWLYGAKMRAIDVFKTQFILIPKEKGNFGGVFMCESILKNYKFLVAEVKLLKIDLEEAEEYKDTARQENIKSRLKIKEAELNKIDKALNKLKPDDLELIKMLYFEKYRLKDVAASLFYSEGQLRYRRNNIITRLTALIMG
jgi:DNA-directed RNA polymerase specialized sigma24 family protein